MTDEDTAAIVDRFGQILNNPPFSPVAERPVSFNPTLGMPYTPEAPAGAITPPPPATTDDYAHLRAVLDLAYDQSATGKGKERHANGKPFHRQPILEIGRMVGPGFQTGQAMKKLQEASGMERRGETDAAIRELLGAIVYTAAAVLLLEEQRT